MAMIEIKLAGPGESVYVQCKDKEEANEMIERIENNLMGGGHASLKLSNGTQMLLGYHGYEYIRVSEA